MDDKEYEDIADHRGVEQATLERVGEDLAKRLFALGARRADEPVAYGDVVEAVGKALREAIDPIGFDQPGWSIESGLYDARSEQDHACQPACDCSCHATNVDACCECSKSPAPRSCDTGGKS